MSCGAPAHHGPPPALKPPSLLKSPAGQARAKSLGDACPEMTRGQSRVVTDGLRFYASKPVAHIGRYTISAQAFNLEARKIDKVVRSLHRDAIAPYVTMILERVVTRCLLVRESTSMTQPEPAAIEEAVRHFEARYDTEAKRDTFYRSAGLNAREHRRELALEVQLRAHIEAATPIVVPEQALRDDYVRKRRQLRVAPRVTMRQLMLPLARTADATDELLARGRIDAIIDAHTTKKRTFEELVRAHSGGPRAKQGGLHREISYDALPREVAAVARYLEPYTLSEPILSPLGFHLIVVEVHHPAYTPSFEEARPTLERDLHEHYYRRARKRWLDNLRARTRVELHPEAIIVEQKPEAP